MNEYCSCQELRNAIHFLDTKIAFCCQSSARFGETFCLKNDYKGEPIDWSNMQDIRTQYIEGLKNNKFSKFCENCALLENRQWEAYDNKIHKVIISHWTKCNCNCIYCLLDKAQPQPEYNIINPLKDMFEKGIIAKDCIFLFGGGEPTCLKELPDILNLITEKGISDIQINSSGIEYSPIIAKYLPLNNFKLTISPDSSDSAMYEKIKQVKQSDRVWENIKKYAEAQKDNKYAIQTKFIIIENVNDSEDEIRKWLLKSKEYGINEVILDVESSYYSQNENNIPSSIINLIHFFEKFATELNLRYRYYANADMVIRSSFNNL